MLYNILPQYEEFFQVFNIFRYITVRSAGALITSLLLCWIFGPKIIQSLRLLQNGVSTVRQYTPESHLKKQGTPSMGGIMILLSVCVSVVVWTDITNGYVWIMMFVMLGYGVLGFTDDYNKLKKRDMSSKVKFICQCGIAIVAVLWFQYIVDDSLKSVLVMPFVKDTLVDLGFLFIPFAIVVMVGASNAVNLTDGLDGLASVPILIAAGCYGAIAYLVGNVVYSQYLFIPYVSGVGELTIVASAIVGAMMGFLWFNAPPASVFMGDTGSLFLGGSLGALSVLTKNEIILSIIGGVFVVEALSVIIQVTSFRLIGKRVFAMAPLHHHYEKKGLPESKIVIRFWICAIILAIIGLSTLKLR